METINLNGKEYEVKFTTYSLSKLKELNLTEVQELVEKGNVFALTETLLMLTNAILCSNGVNVKEEIVSSYLDEAFTKGVEEPSKMLEKLIGGLTSSPFFKALQQAAENK